MQVGDKVKTIEVDAGLGEEFLLGEVGKIVRISHHIADKNNIIVDVSYTDEIMNDLYDYPNYEEETNSYMMFAYQLEVVK